MNNGISDKNMSQVSYYSVKTLLKNNVANTFEERILLYKVADFSEAINMAIKDSKNYLKNMENVDFLGIIDAFHIFDNSLSNGSEIYSHIYHSSKYKTNDFINIHFDMDKGIDSLYTNRITKT
jgi:hypothetical protein